ncbi:unnamed protein product, partial [Didymodactylos carnosus]
NYGHLNIDFMSSTAKLPQLLITIQLPNEYIDMLSSKFDIVYHHNKSELIEHELLLKLTDENHINAILFTGGVQIDKELLEYCVSHLKALSTLSVGYDHIDVKECQKRHIPIGYTPNVPTNSIADLTVALLLATSRQLIECIDIVKQENWNWNITFLCGKSLENSTVGIGRIGSVIQNSFVLELQRGQEMALQIGLSDQV